MRNRITLMVLGMLPAPYLFAQVPRGYHVVQLTNTDFADFRARINTRGEVVFTRWIDPGDRLTEEIFLLNVQGELIRITNDNIQDVGPDINNDGVITWARGLGPVDPNTGEPTLEIVVYRDGEISRLTFNSDQDVGPRMNSEAQITWYRYMGPGCLGVVMDIYFFDGSQIIPITTDAIREGVANQIPAINSRSEITWTRFNFCDNPWTSKIMLFRDGVVSELTDGSQIRPSEPDIDSAGAVVWSHFPPLSDGAIEIWENGVVREVTDWGLGPHINDAGLVTFDRWHADMGEWHQWLYRDGVFLKISEGFPRNLRGDLNSLGEIVWQSGPSGSSDIMLMKRFSGGDLNCDGVIDAFDIEPFLLALFDAPSYSKRYPQCDFALGDLNDDGSVDAFDIEPFVDLLFP